MDRIRSRCWRSGRGAAGLNPPVLYSTVKVSGPKPSVPFGVVEPPSAVSILIVTDVGHASVQVWRHTESQCPRPKVLSNSPDELNVGSTTVGVPDTVELGYVPRSPRTLRGSSPDIPVPSLSFNAAASTKSLSSSSLSSCDIGSTNTTSILPIARSEAGVLSDWADSAARTIDEVLNQPRPKWQGRLLSRVEEDFFRLRTQIT